MTERRETGRKASRGAHQRRPHRTSSAPSHPTAEPERIAKYLARCGVASRREAEALIEQGKVYINGDRCLTPATKVTGSEEIRVGRRRVKPPEPTRLWRYHKPAGLVTTNSDPAGRSTVFENLPSTLPRVITVGRLDLTTEGLLLLTNDGELARALELPSSGLKRIYRARAHGKVTDEALKQLADGITVDGETFAPILAELERVTGTNAWLRVELAEGKKREVRRALAAVGLEVNRLIRIAYGPIELGKLARGAVEEISSAQLLTAFGKFLPEAHRPDRPEPSKRPDRRMKRGRHPSKR